MRKQPKRGIDVTAQLERAAFAQAELNYLNGATALVQQEIALTQQAMYHKPAFNRNWAWDYQNEARIRGGNPAKQYDWDKTVEARRDAEDDDRPVLRDAGCNTTLTEIIEDPIGTKIAVRDDTIYQGYDPAGSRDKPREKGLLAYAE